MNERGREERGKEKERAPSPTGSRRRKCSRGRSPKSIPDRCFDRIRAEGFSIFVGNLPFDYTVEDLHKIFGHYGKVIDVYIPPFPGTRKSKGFAFVHFHYADDGRAAIGVLNGRKIDDKEVIVTEAKPRTRALKKNPLTKQASASRSKAGSNAEAVKNGGSSQSSWNHRQPQLQSPNIITVADPDTVTRRLKELKLGLIG
ncbi:serine/arginine-rich splicing factor SC35-like [Magnolia sinica]|uniref:serine/arginine-rich splicing factor SC35-like n=1 Tax=Magnolia sinica TaxID=86752 RepID=UPI00265A8554|nr:serine/arginine-rich splicing factor SC35-like [Magnolia sinica]